MDPARRNTKFGILAFDRCSGVEIDNSQVLGDGVSVYPDCPIELPAHWNTWLGSIQSENLTRANLTFTVQINSETPTFLDDETKQLLKQLEALRFGLFFHGIPTYRNNLIALGGIDNHGEASVRQVEIPMLAYFHPCGRTPVITMDSLVGANTCATRIVSLMPGNDDAFRRIRAGLRACVYGMQERDLPERLHQFVRALDGLTMIPPGQGANRFSQRAQLFAAGTNIADTLIELYRLRSAQEHLNDLRQALATQPEEDFRRLVSLRAYQAEQAALTTYRQLLTTPHLLTHLESETSINEFWALNDEMRRDIWGAACDMDAVEAQHDETYAILGDP